LRATGVYIYAKDPTTDIWCMAYSFEDPDNVRLWVPGDPVPPEVEEHILKGGRIKAWNANFERIISWNILEPRYGFPHAELEQYWDTAADAAALGLPRKLVDAARVLGAEAQKDMEGHRLMMQMARPRRLRKGEPRGELYWFDDVTRRHRLYEYCKDDVRTEMAVGAKLRPLSPEEREMYLLDQRINDRGVMVDVPLAVAATEIVEEGKRRANRELTTVTNNELESVTKVADMTEWLNARVGIDNIRKDTLRDLLDSEDDLDPDVRRVVEIRREVGKSSTSKLNSLLNYADADDQRARGMLLYHGAATGRWSGRGPQPQNLPRPTVKQVERYIPWVLDGEFDLIEAEHPALVVVSSMLRSMFRAAPGHLFRSGDFAQVEARVLAWIAEQDDLVEAFRKGAAIYEEMAALICDVPVEEIKNPSERRTVGKNNILGSGFGMGSATFQERVKIATGIEISDELSAKAINTYRGRYCKIPAFWKQINQAAIQAVKHPGDVTRVGRNGSIRYTVRGPFLWCVLPSGRVLAYAKPHFERHVVRPKDGDPFETWGVSFMALNSFTRKWERRHGYGGLWTENVVQAMARDLLAEAMIRLDKAGHPIILTVHDEILTEPPLGFGSMEEFLDLMTTVPPWAKGLPVAVEGWEGTRYRK
ncbi:MAG TPA: DNA polymerase, partial [Longimicrobiales bacterium]|nr:DNA polymerase [Longimicrobiales bacterium]